MTGYRDTKGMKITRQITLNATEIKHAVALYLENQKDLIECPNDSDELSLSVRSDNPEDDPDVCLIVSWTEISE